jgi:hypothetical protein
MEHSASAKPCHRFREDVCISRTLVWARSLPSYDQNVAAAGADADRISWAAHVEDFRCVRLSTISLVRNMPSHAWMRSGIASDNRFTVRALVFVIAGHLVHHDTALRERYL